MTVRILVGDAVAQLRTLESESVQCCVTSPPYWGLRNYGVDGQIGLEPTPDEYVARMVDVFREVRRVLRQDGTLWLNLGDSYAGGKTGRDDADRPNGQQHAKGKRHVFAKQKAATAGNRQRSVPDGLKSKDLVGTPWLTAFALRSDGWYLRADNIWHKPNPMPESVTDRTTKAHEYVFHFSRSATYYYDAAAIAEPSDSAGQERAFNTSKKAGRVVDRKASGNEKPGAPKVVVKETRNRRSVWTISPVAFSGSHFATMPPELAETCIKAGSRKGDTVLDPFGGAGTTALVADRLERNAILCELNPEYAQIAQARIRGDSPMFADVEVRVRIIHTLSEREAFLYGGGIVMGLKPSASHRSSHCRGTSGMGSPASQRRIVRSSRIITSTAKRRAERPDAPIARRSRSACVVMDLARALSVRTHEYRTDHTLLDATGERGAALLALEGRRADDVIGGLNLVDRLSADVVSRHRGRRPEMRTAVAGAVVAEVQRVFGGLHIDSFQVGRDCPDTNEYRAYALTAQGALKDRFRGLA